MPEISIDSDIKLNALDSKPIGELKKNVQIFTMNPHYIAKMSLSLSLSLYSNMRKQKSSMHAVKQNSSFRNCQCKKLWHSQFFFHTVPNETK